MSTNLTPASLWILNKYIILEKSLEQNLQSYELAHSVDGLYKYLWDFYADWYVEYLKTSPDQKPFAKELFKQFIITLSPYMPFETEALWKEYFNESGLLALQKKDFNWSLNTLQTTGLTGKEIATQINEFELVVEFVQNLRSLRGLFAIDPANAVEIYTTSKQLLGYSQFIKLIAKGTLIDSQKPELYTVKTSDFTYSIDILAYIKDKQIEIQRTEKLILNLEKQASSLQSQLSNTLFLEKAEVEVIDSKKQDLQNRLDEIKQQQEKLNFLTK
jgi:valyl-tRNA synthetase